MCLQNDSKGRRSMIVIGSGCLALGLGLPVFVHPVTPVALNAMHFASGLLMGVSIALNLSAVWRISRQRRLGSGSGL